MQKWKMALGTMALGAVTISPFIAEVAFAGAEKAIKKVKPPEPTAAEVEQGQLLDKGPRWKPSVNTQSPSGGDTPVDAPAVDVEQGQLLDKGPRWKPSVNAQSPTGGDTPVDAPAVDVEQGQLLDKGPRWKPSVAAAADNDICGVPYTPPCQSNTSTAKKAAAKSGSKPNEPTAAKIETGQKLDKPRWPYTVSHFVTIGLGSAAAIGALVAFTGGNDGPTSP